MDPMTPDEEAELVALLTKFTENLDSNKIAVLSAGTRIQEIVTNREMDIPLSVFEALPPEFRGSAVMSYVAMGLSYVK